MRFSRKEYWSGAPLPSPKNTITDIKNTLEGSNSKLSEAEKQTSELGYRIVETEAKQNKEKRIKRNEDSLKQPL